MLVKCIGNTPNHLSSEHSKQAYAKYIHQDEVCLKIGREYSVYGIAFMYDDNLPWYLVCEEESDEYPVPYLAELFKIIDGEIPLGWEFTSSATNVGNIALLPKYWANNPSFLEKLVDGDKKSQDYFLKLKEKLKKKKKVPES